MINIKWRVFCSMALTALCTDGNSFSSTPFYNISILCDNENERPFDLSNYFVFAVICCPFSSQWLILCVRSLVLILPKHSIKHRCLMFRKCLLYWDTSHLDLKLTILFHFSLICAINDSFILLKCLGGKFPCFLRNHECHCSENMKVAYIFWMPWNSEIALIWNTKAEKMLHITTYHSTTLWLKE